MNLSDTMKGFVFLYAMDNYICKTLCIVVDIACVYKIYFNNKIVDDNRMMKMMSLQESRPSMPICDIAVNALLTAVFAVTYN